MTQNSSPKMAAEQDQVTTSKPKRVGVYDNSTQAAPDGSSAKRVGVYDRPATRLSALPTPVLIGLIIAILLLSVLSFVVFRAIF